MKRALFLIWLVILYNVSPEKCSSQIYFNNNLSGYVTDASNEKPIFNANIFLANTTIGTASDSQGHFSITNIPPGQYQLVVSMIGYDVVHETVHIPGDRTIDVKLNPSLLQGETVTVTAERPGAWQKNFSIFRQLLLGGSEFSDSCVFSNTYVLVLDYDMKSHTLTASTKEPLHIKNNALGYDVYLTIEEFKYQGVGFYKFRGLPYFKPQKPDGERQKEIWERNRKKAYNGSLRHFLSALANGTALHEQGFTASSASSVSDDRGLLKENKPSSPNYIDSLIHPGRSKFESIIKFKDYLKIVYKNEPESVRYRQYAKPRKFQTSWIYIDSDEPVYFNVFGYLYDPYQIKTYGYWGWKGIAESLPFDYLPEQVYPLRRMYMAPVRYKAIAHDNVIDSLSYSPEQLYMLSLKRIEKHDFPEASSLLYRGLVLESKQGSNVYDSTFSFISKSSAYADSLLFIGNHSADKIIQYWQECDPTPASMEHELYCTIISRLMKLQALSKRSGAEYSTDMRNVFLQRGMPDTIHNSFGNSHIGQNICWIYKTDSSEAVYDFIRKGTMYVPFSIDTVLDKNPSRSQIDDVLDFIQSRSFFSASYSDFLTRLNNELPQTTADGSGNGLYGFLSRILPAKLSAFTRELCSVRSTNKYVKIKNEYKKIDIRYRVEAILNKPEPLYGISIGIPGDYVASNSRETGEQSSFMVHYSIFNRNDILIERKSFDCWINYDESMPHSAVLGVFNVFAKCPEGVDTMFLFLQVTDTVAGVQWTSERIKLTTQWDSESSSLWLSDAIPCHSFGDSITVMYPDTLSAREHIDRIKFFACGLVPDSAGMCRYTYRVHAEKISAENRKTTKYTLIPGLQRTSNRTCIEESVYISPVLKDPGVYRIIIEFEDNVSKIAVDHHSTIHLFTK